MKKVALIILLIFTVVVLFVLFNNKEEKSTPPKQKTKVISKMELTGWFAAWNSERASTALPQVMPKLTTFAPMLYRVTDGKLARHDINNRAEIISYARDNNIPIAPLVTDESSTASIQKLLNNNAAQSTFINDLVTEAQQENFVGWSIDIEKITSKDKEAFSSFIKNTANVLHKNNLKLHVIAYGRVADEPYDPAKAHDFEVFGKYADEVHLMTHNYSNKLTDPGGQTPLEWYRSVLTYALETIPQEKIVITLSMFGNDWGEDDSFKGLTYPEVQQRIQEEKPTITYDKNQSSMVGHYKKNNIDHTMMFENVRTIKEKMKLAREEFNINKFAIWSLGNEDSELWEQL